MTGVGIFIVFFRGRCGFRVVLCSGLVYVLVEGWIRIESIFFFFRFLGFYDFEERIVYCFVFLGEFDVCMGSVVLEMWGIKKE